MGGGGKGGGAQSTTTTAQPWSGAQGYLQQGYHDLQQIYQTGGPTGPTQYGAGQINVPSYYPGSTVAPMSPYTQGAIQAQAQRAANGSPLIDNAQNMASYISSGQQAQDSQRAAPGQQAMMQTSSGAYLNSNPYLQGAINYATAPVESSINSAFSSAGRYGSGAQADALSRGVGDISSQMAFQNYNAERQRQEQASAGLASNYQRDVDRALQASALAPGLAQQDYFDINQLGASGSAIDAYNQAQINADIDRYNYESDPYWQRAQQYIAAVSGSPWGSSTTQRGASPNSFSSAIGGGLSGAGIGNAILPGGWGAGIGGALGLLGGIFR